MKPAMRVDSRLHRPVMVLDDACAEEVGNWRRANAAADAPDLYALCAPCHAAKESQEPPVRIRKLLALSALVVAVAGAAALVWP